MMRSASRRYYSALLWWAVPHVGGAFRSYRGSPRSLSACLWAPALLRTGYFPILDAKNVHCAVRAARSSCTLRTRVTPFAPRVLAPFTLRGEGRAALRHVRAARSSSDRPRPPGRLHVIAAAIAARSRPRPDPSRRPRRPPQAAPGPGLAARPGKTLRKGRASGPLPGPPTGAALARGRFPRMAILGPLASLATSPDLPPAPRPRGLTEAKLPSNLAAGREEPRSPRDHACFGLRPRPRRPPPPPRGGSPASALAIGAGAPASCGGLLGLLAAPPLAGAWRRGRHGWRSRRWQLRRMCELRSASSPRAGADRSSLPAGLQALCTRRDGRRRIASRSSPISAAAGAARAASTRCSRSATALSPRSPRPPGAESGIRGRCGRAAARPAPGTHRARPRPHASRPSRAMHAAAVHAEALFARAVLGVGARDEERFFSSVADSGAEPPRRPGEGAAGAAGGKRGSLRTTPCARARTPRVHSRGGGAAAATDEIDRVLAAMQRP